MIGPGAPPAWDSWAEVYDLADADRTTYVTFYTGLVTDRMRSVLDLGCGTGTITIPLARELARQHADPAGVRAVGIDESPRMLAIAEDRAQRSEEAFRRIEWVRGDMRALPFDGPFDLVVSAYISLQYLLGKDELEQAFDEARRVIAETGLFAFDLYQPNPEYLAAGHMNRLARVVTDECGQTLEIREDASYDDRSRILTIDWRLVRSATPDTKPIARLRQRIRQYFPDELERLLAGSDFSIRARFGDVDRSQFTPHSRKQVYVCSPSARRRAAAAIAPRSRRSAHRGAPGLNAGSAPAASFGAASASR